MIASSDDLESIQTVHIKHVQIPIQLTKWVNSPTMYKPCLKHAPTLSLYICVCV